MESWRGVITRLGIGFQVEETIIYSAWGLSKIQVGNGISGGGDHCSIVR